MREPDNRIILLIQLFSAATAGLLAAAAAPAQGFEVLSGQPAIVDVSPAEAEPGMPIAIRVAGFSPELVDQGLEVSFDGVPGEVQAQKGTYLTVLVPAELTPYSESPTIVVYPTAQPDLRAAAKGRLRLYFSPVTAEDPLRAWGWFPWVAGLSAILLLVLGYFAGRRRPTAALSTASGIVTDARAASVEIPTAVDVGPPKQQVSTGIELPPLEVPDDLIQAFGQGNVFAHLGTGLGAPSGLPSWDALMAELVGELRRRGALDESQATSISSILGTDQYRHIAESFIHSLGADTVTLSEAIVAVYSRYDAEPSEAHRLVAELPFAAWLSGSFDTLFEQALAEVKPQAAERVLTPREAEEALDAVSRAEPFVYKLYGNVGSAAPLTFGVQEYVDRVRSNAAYEELLDKLFLTQTLLFIGSSLEDIEGFMRGIDVRATPSRRHYALTAVDDPNWELKARVLERRFNIRILPFHLAQCHEMLTGFLRDLSRTLATGEEGLRPGELRPRRQEAWLSELTLRNIGPFEELTLRLDRHWNLLLGDNGVGKSTILKAVAVALCGDKAAPFAERIVNRNSTMAEITLRAGDDVHTTIIRRRTRSGVDIESVGSLAGDQLHWLVLGFPALRTVTWNRPAAEGSLGARRPTPGDVLPILRDEPDPRLDGLKQRIVTLDHLRKTAQVEGLKSAHGRLMDDFFTIFEDLTVGLNVRFAAVDPETREITIETQDGMVPIESLSQGTISLISWVGVLLQRLYEVTPEDQDPRSRYAIVMIDEIDAHMHPAWQTTLVGSLSKIFPEVQFIATTHSPLVVRGMEKAQVTRLKRNDAGKVEVVDVPEDMLMGRPDQVLAGALFDVDADLDKVTESYIADYQTLLGKSARTAEEEKRFRELEQILEFRIPVPATTPPDRRAQELVTALVDEQVNPASEEMSRAVQDRAKALFAELTREHDRVMRDSGKT